jgi:hypothetical protein
VLFHVAGPTGGCHTGRHFQQFKWHHVIYNRRRRCTNSYRRCHSAYTGFQQSGISVSVLGEPDPGFSITVYPNPATEILNLKIVREDLGDLQYVVFDINGIIIIQKKVEAMETTIDLKQLSKGIYIIRIREGLTELKSFKIIKL